MRTKTIGVLSLMTAMTLLTAACDSSEPELSTTSSVVSEAEGDASGSSTTTTPDEPSASTTATTTLVGESVSSWELVARESTDNGDIVFIVIPQGAYTDVDMENFAGDLIEREVVAWGAEVFDDATAVDAFMKDAADRTEADNALLDQHHFFSIQASTTLIFRGPFEDSGRMVIGS